jgi:hypothetical protein
LPALSLSGLVSRILTITTAVLALVLLGGPAYALAFRGKGEKAGSPMEAGPAGGSAYADALLCETCLLTLF